MDQPFFPNHFVGAMVLMERDPLVPNTVWFQAEHENDGLLYNFPAGTLAAFSHLTTDLLLDGDELAVFVLTLQEGENGPAFRYSFGLLNQCSARLRMPLESVNQNRWRYEREGALLKPLCWGDRVDLARVDRMGFSLMRKGLHPVAFSLSPLTATDHEPELLSRPMLPKGALLDELGQNTLRTWEGKSLNPEQVTSRLHAQLAAAPEQRLPEGLSRWGGWLSGRCDATGFFRVFRDGPRWWLVDPDGYRFWSAGVDCVRVDGEANVGGLEPALSWRPDPQGEYAAIYSGHEDAPMVNYLAANLIRAFGPKDWYAKWAQIALAELRRTGFNTVGNWSDWKIASQAGMPYVRPLAASYDSLPAIYRDFPDVFHPDFADVLETYAAQLETSKDDPALIGYFLMNEPSWGFADESPAAGMLFNTLGCHSRTALAGFLRQRYADDAALAAAWELPVSFDLLAEGRWTLTLTESARRDLDEFSAIMVERFFGGLSEACRRVDHSHLNLGVRYYTVPPAWALDGMRHFDVFSMNCYKKRLPADEMERISAMLNLPIMIGEWHFGALDAGLPASGIGHVPNQAGRGKAYRVYLEDAASQPWCVGVHYFILYDQSALGRFDGENYNIGFLDVCNRPYDPLTQAARLSHARLYQVASGELPPFDQEPAYLPMLFL